LSFLLEKGCETVDFPVRPAFGDVLPDEYPLPGLLGLVESRDAFPFFGTPVVLSIWPTGMWPGFVVAPLAGNVRLRSWAASH